jgi:hypothetical protein
MTIASAFGAGTDARAQESRVVYAAMTFKTEAGPLRTSACLQLTERVYPSLPWWESAEGYATGPDRAFKAVIAAIKKRDRASLLKWTNPDQARDTARFDQQAGAFFQQFESIKLLAVPRAYEFDGLVVYFGTFQSPTQTAVVPLAFAYQGGDSFGFLPSRSDKLTFVLVNDWFIPPTGAPAESPSYCTVAEVKRATHRVPLLAVSWRPSVLLLTGVPLDDAAPATALGTRVRSAIAQMKTALRPAEPSTFYGFLTPEGAGRLRAWFASAAPADRDGYKKAFLEHEPFFMFDQGPLVVVYMKSPAGEIQTMYFTAAGDMGLLWTNSSHITVSDRVFKQGPLFAAASASKPFSSLVIK